jgi:hypothetical protein
MRSSCPVEPSFPQVTRLRGLAQHPLAARSCGLVWSNCVHKRAQTSSKVQVREIDIPLTCTFVEPPIGIEPMTYALRMRRSSRLS